MLLTTIGFHNKNQISKSTAVKTIPTQAWVGWSPLYELSSDLPNSRTPSNMRTPRKNMLKRMTIKPIYRHKVKKL